MHDRCTFPKATKPLNSQFQSVVLQENEPSHNTPFQLQMVYVQQAVSYERQYLQNMDLTTESGPTQSSAHH